MVTWLTYLDAALAVGRSAWWVRANANRGLIRRQTIKIGARQRAVVAEEDVVALAGRLDTARTADLQLTTTPDPPDGMVSIVAAAEILGCCRNYVHELGQAGRLQIQSGRPFSWVPADQVHQVLLDWYDGHEPDQVMTYTEAAGHLGINVESVRYRIRKGQLTSVGRKRHARVLRAEVEALRAP